MKIWKSFIVLKYFAIVKKCDTLPAFSVLDRLSLEYTDPKILIKPESPTPGLQTMIDDIKTLKNSQGLLETRKDSERFRKTPKDSERLRNFISGCLNLNK
ncbi:hypothetical protein PV326_013121 [Microctonus aethiopoides]|nr:hypothetical protein PV326_013121 [Microctonus aethiopoides]